MDILDYGMRLHRQGKSYIQFVVEREDVTSTYTYTALCNGDDLLFVRELIDVDVTLTDFAYFEKYADQIDAIWEQRDFQTYTRFDLTRASTPVLTSPITPFYVSPDGDNADGLSWATAWQTFADINWTTVGNTGALVYIDEGRWEETLTVGSIGVPSEDLTVDTYQSLSITPPTTLASEGWLVITAGSSSGTITEECRIVGSLLQGKTVEGTANSGFSNTSGNVWQVALTTEPKGVWEATTTDLTTKDAAVPLTLQTSVATVEANAGSYWWDSNVLYVHKTGGGDVSVSLYDYEAIIPNRVPLDISSSEGVIFDGGAGQELRLSYGDNDVYNGIIKGAQGQGSTIFRNMQLLYADTEDGHYMNGVSKRVLFYNNNMGKATGNQAFSQSLTTGTHNNLEFFFINNTIWDAIETHGSGTAVHNFNTWYVKDNAMMYERLGDFAGDPGTGSLIRLDSIVGVSADIQITGNTFPNVEDYFSVQTTYGSPIWVEPEFAGTGSIVISDNIIIPTSSVGAVSGTGIGINNTNGLSVTISNNNIEELDSQYAIRVLNQTTPVYIEGNSTLNNLSGVVFANSDEAHIIGNNFQEDIVVSISLAGQLDALYFERNICIAQSTANFCVFRGLTHLYVKNNFIDLNGSGLNSVTIGAISVVSNIIGNIFTGNYDTSIGLDIKDAGGAESQVYGNVFYNLDYGIRLSSNATYNVDAQNNILQTIDNALTNNGNLTYTIESDYNYLYDNDDDYRALGGGVVPVAGANDVAADPLMVSPATGDYSLSGSSPCIGTGVDLGATYQIPYRFIVGTDFYSEPTDWYVVNDEPLVWSIGDLYDR